MEEAAMIMAAVVVVMEITDMETLGVVLVPEELLPVGAMALEDMEPEEVVVEEEVGTVVGMGTPVGVMEVRPGHISVKKVRGHLSQ